MAGKSDMRKKYVARAAAPASAVQAGRERVTRGFGLLERVLAAQRTKAAEELIPETRRGGAILDIGCGASPSFLLATRFATKVGMDKGDEHSFASAVEKGIRCIFADAAAPGGLPFRDAVFEVVSLLAVIEHLSPEHAQELLGDIRRVLKPGGVLVITTPAAWCGSLLRVLAMVRLVSPEEIREHAGLFTGAKLVSMLRVAGFPPASISAGSFECGMNLWVKACQGSEE